MTPLTPLLLPANPEVSVLDWPTEEPLRQQLAWFGLPRILVVGPGTPPPALLDEREDWMRSPADPRDLHARAATLRLRAAERPLQEPWLDDDGLVWLGTSWVALTGAQAPVMRLLLDNLDKVVRYETIVSTYVAAGRSGHPASVRTLLARLATRLRPIGIELTAVRRRGVILTLRSIPARQG